MKSMATPLGFLRARRSLLKVEFMHTVSWLFSNRACDLNLKQRLRAASVGLRISRGWGRWTLRL